MKAGAEQQVAGAVCAMGSMLHQGEVGLNWICWFTSKALAGCQLQEQNWSETNVTPGNTHFWHGGLISSVCVLSSEAQSLLHALLKIALKPTKRLESVFG